MRRKYIVTIGIRPMHPTKNDMGYCSASFEVSTKWLFSRQTLIVTYLKKVVEKMYEQRKVL